jgi:hypothetical protein
MVTQVVVTRPRHPLDGKSLQVLGRQRRRGAVELLVVLPDGSKTLLPAAWTDLEPAAAVCDPAVGSLADLRETVALVAALLARGGAEREQTARQSPAKENHRAAHPAQSDAPAAAGASPAAVRPATPRAGRRGDRAAGPPARPGGDRDGGRR